MDQRNAQRLKYGTLENMLTTKSQINRSHIRVHSTKGQRDIYNHAVQSKLIDSSNPQVMSLNNTQMASPGSRSGKMMIDDNNSSQLPTVN